MVLFGSQARGEGRASSDVDLLVVVSPGLELDRNLYRRWDVAVKDRRVSPHFVHLPDAVSSAGSIWYEVALDGVILDEQNHRISAFLQSVRRAIADGRLRRRYAHGHPYWVENSEVAIDNDSLVDDYLLPARHRLAAVKVLMDLESWADVVRESQEIVEITLKALLRACRVEVPRIHDVSALLEQNRDLLPRSVRERIDELSEISRSLRRDRETAMTQASLVVGIVSEALTG